MNKHSKGPWRTDGPTNIALVEVVDASDLLVLKMCMPVREDNQFYEECQANLRLVLHATQLLAVVRELMGFRCSVGITAWCGRCEESAGCPLLAAQTLLEKIDGKEKATMAERKREFVWDTVGSDDVLWCDGRHLEAIRGVRGVASVGASIVPANRYFVVFDPRYDRDAVKAEIEAIITGQT